MRRAVLASPRFHSLIVFALFGGIYSLSVDLHSANLMRFNFLFDLDIPRVARVFNGIGSENAMNHPHYALYFSWVGSALYSLTGDRVVSAAAITMWSISVTTAMGISAGQT